MQAFFFVNQGTREPGDGSLFLQSPGAWRPLKSREFCVTKLGKVDSMDAGDRREPGDGSLDQVVQFMIMVYH